MQFLASDGLATGYLVLIAVVVALLLALFVAALVSIWKHPGLSQGGKLLWSVICLVLQFFGPLAWFLWGRHNTDLGT